MEDVDKKRGGAPSAPSKLVFLCLNRGIFRNPQGHYRGANSSPNHDEDPTNVGSAIIKIHRDLDDRQCYQYEKKLIGMSLKNNIFIKRIGEFSAVGGIISALILSVRVSAHP